MMFGELQRPGPPHAKAVAKELLQRYAARIASKLDDAKVVGKVPSGMNTHAAAVLFIVTIQGLVMQSMISSNLSAAKRNAPAVFRIYRRGIEARQAETDGPRQLSRVLGRPQKRAHRPLALSRKAAV